jgi:thiamine transport system substrate-binding protein
MRRRRFLSAGAAAVAAGLAGCTTSTDDSAGTAGTTTGSTRTPADSLTVATYGTFVDAPSDSPGTWIQEEFEDRHDVEFEWEVPERPINYFIEQHNAGETVDSELYLGIKPQELVRVDRATDGELFQSIDRDGLKHVDDIGAEFDFDPSGRTVPTYANYVSLVYDGRKLDNPGTFEALTTDAYADALAVPNPAQTNTGLYFLLWTVSRFGEDGDYTYLDYWRDLLDNGARVVGTWGSMYSQFTEGEVPMVVSYSNDQVYARRSDSDLEKHQVGFLNDQGYANLNAVARFASGTKDDLATRFVDFVLSPEVQAKIAELNVTGPVNTEATPPEVYQEYAKEPEDGVFLDYDRLDGNVGRWQSEVERELVEG